MKTFEINPINISQLKFAIEINTQGITYLMKTFEINQMNSIDISQLKSAIQIE